MLKPILNQLINKRIVLASGSPRRQEYIHKIGIENVELCPSLFEENLNPKDYLTFEEYVVDTALHKVFEVNDRLSKDPSTKPDVVIGADTMVVLGDKMYGKPKTPEVAFQMLSEYVDIE